MSLARSSLSDAFNSYSLGFGSLFDQILTLSETHDSFPPENVVQESETRVRVELALAGFDKSEIKVYTENGRLTVEGVKQTKTEENYLKRRLAQRNFRWQKPLSHHLQVDGVTFVNGLLSITLNRHIPEHEKRKDYSF
jgi:molecular chaperone IbpA